MLNRNVSQFFSRSLNNKILCAQNRVVLARPESGKPSRSTYRQESAAAETSLIEVGKVLFDNSFKGKLEYPHKSFSKTHSAGSGWACGSTTSEGIGIDVEYLRDIDAKVHKFFVGPSERRRLDETTDALSVLRTWTAKEALFKADPDNKQRVLTDYVIETLPSNEVAGKARCGAKRFVFQTLQLESEILSVACLVEDPK
jgi:phosphopantetheinyl transferase